MRHKLLSVFILLLAITPLATMAQVAGATAEDSVQGNWLQRHGTTIGGYGNAFYQHDFRAKNSNINLERVVLFIGHKFSKKISFFSELELEDAKVSGGKLSGEIAFEQAYLKFNIKQNHYIVAGLFLPRIGILNENHLPNSFNGNERTQVETYIIPSTWRELGVGYYGSASRIPLNFSVALVNGLSSAAFEHGSGLREGRFEGSNATAGNFAITAALQYNINNFKIQASGYYGGTVGLSSRQADSLKLTSGIFGTPVAMGEINGQFQAKGFSAKILGCIVSIPNAQDIDRAYANNTPSLEYGAYAELAYNVLETVKKAKENQLIVFARYEKLNMNAALPSNGLIDGTLDQNHLIVGLGYLPIKNVVIKVDVRLLQTGDQNPALIVNPNPAALPYQNTNALLNVGIGYSF